MGEWSRRIGEVGEEVVGEFFDLIGWSDSQRNLSLTCTRSERHRTGTRPRSTHGVDYLFSYESQLAHRTVDHLVTSVKYTLNPYPASPGTKFKEHFSDLATTLECFKRSENLRSANNQFSGVDNSREIGILFWLSSDGSGEEDILQKIANVRNIDQYNYGSIYVVDNKRVSFIYDTIKHLVNANPSSDLNFFYPNTGKNYNAINRESSGKVLPAEFINSGVIPFKLTHQDKSKTFVVASIDGFHQDNLKRLMGMSHTMGLDLARDTAILFPDFDVLRHENQVSEAKSSFRDKHFTGNVRVSSYRPDFRSIRNE